MSVTVHHAGTVDVDIERLGSGWILGTHIMQRPDQAPLGTMRAHKGSDQLRSPDLTRLDFKVKVFRCTAATAGLS